jgi:hypothetical protein
MYKIERIYLFKSSYLAECATVVGPITTWRTSWRAMCVCLPSSPKSMANVTIAKANLCSAKMTNWFVLKATLQFTPLHHIPLHFNPNRPLITPASNLSPSTPFNTKSWTTGSDQEAIGCVQERHIPHGGSFSQGQAAGGFRDHIRSGRYDAKGH